jgi:hypothetical protein
MNGGRGYRWMYYMTGLPGWMRLGFSPGWSGVSPYGLGPAAQYLLYGTWPTPQMQALWQSGQISGYTPYPGYPMPGFPTPYDPWGMAQITPEQEMNMLKAQAQDLERQLKEIRSRIAELEKKEE